MMVKRQRGTSRCRGESLRGQLQNLKVVAAGDKCELQFRAAPRPNRQYVGAWSSLSMAFLSSFYAEIESDQKYVAVLHWVPHDREDNASKLHNLSFARP